VLSHPEWGLIAPQSLLPTSSQIITDPDMLYIAISILGATVMPHNLYLHSAIVQTRDYKRTLEGKREAIRFANIDSAIALMIALFVNAAILVVAAAVFHPPDILKSPRSKRIQTAIAYVASPEQALFRCCFAASGQNSTITARWLDR